MAALGVCAASGEPLRVTVDLSSAKTGKTIANKFSDINVWMIDSTWLKTVADYPDDYFKRRFPFVERIQLMAATGGNAARDLFVNPTNRATTADTDFRPLIKACENIRAKGLKPMIKTGWVPLKLSANPRIGKAFKTNLRPPCDYDAYYAYIRTAAEALKARFGVEDMRSWSWGVGVEYENKDWFEAEDGRPESTKAAYCKLYDYTVAALTDALGTGNLTVGAHSMTVSEGLWDERDFIEHCAKGINAKTGETGTQLDFLAISYYTKVPGFDSEKFLKAIRTVREKADQVGLARVKIGIDEGRVLDGWDNRVLYPRETEHPIQAASDARLFQLMVEHDVDYFSMWRLTTRGVFGGIPAVSTHLRSLAFRMVGSRTLAETASGEPADPKDIVGVLSGFDAGHHVLRILAYNLNLDQRAQSRESAALCVDRVKPRGRTDVTVRTWRLDADHGNWWKPWQADIAARHMGKDAFKYSVWTFALPSELSKSADAAFWKSREADYGKAGEMRPSEEQRAVNPDGTLTLPTDLPPEGVVLYEIFPVEAASAP